MATSRNISHFGQADTMVGSKACRQHLEGVVILVAIRDQDLGVWQAQIADVPDDGIDEAA